MRGSEIQRCHTSSGGDVSAAKRHKCEMKGKSLQSLFFPTTFSTSPAMLSLSRVYANDCQLPWSGRIMRSFWLEGGSTHQISDRSYWYVIVHRRTVHYVTWRQSPGFLSPTEFWVPKRAPSMIARPCTGLIEAHYLYLVLLQYRRIYGTSCCTVVIQHSIFWILNTSMINLKAELSKS